jgi:hypothetical protein
MQTVLAHPMASLCLLVFLTFGIGVLWSARKKSWVWSRRQWNETPPEQRGPTNWYNFLWFIAFTGVVLSLISMEVIGRPWWWPY